MFTNSNHVKGLMWFILSLLISNFNDVAAKLVIVRLDPLQIASLRFFWSVVSLIPCIIYYGTKCLKTKSISIHIVRGALFYIAIAMWIWGVGVVSLSTVTTISFTVPVFVLLLAPRFLKEKVGVALWLSTTICLIGAVLALEPLHEDFKPLSLLLLCASAMFGTLDVINKRYIVKEGTIPMLFYSALVSFACSIPGAVITWTAPTGYEMLTLALLGAGSNAILYCILTSFKYIAASALSPYRYLELILSIVVGYVCFSETPTFMNCVGSFIIVLSTLYIAKQQMKSKNDA